ncbi:hypothetical protein ACNAN0_09820 [Agrilactobacillus fermenti]|uniref:hypothetical protein n=1 Tax=Agrilactobacillus fermenti TaxID=2586909 RepID=UPI001E4F9740|nr:hypothetical protein [Agrilactobacillus fermenti]MCD2255950.1 hypothetical protein [Agrilactobacillus fermenti]
MDNFTGWWHEYAAFDFYDIVANFALSGTPLKWQFPNLYWWQKPLSLLTTLILVIALITISKNIRQTALGISIITGGLIAMASFGFIILNQWTTVPIFSGNYFMIGVGAQPQSLTYITAVPLLFLNQAAVTTNQIVGAKINFIILTVALVVLAVRLTLHRLNYVRLVD